MFNRDTADTRVEIGISVKPAERFKPDFHSGVRRRIKIKWQVIQKVLIQAIFFARHLFG